MKIIAGMATFKGRYDIIQDTIDSILPQVDMLNIYDNDNELRKITKYHPKINITYDYDRGDLTDRGKFYTLNEFWLKPCYFFGIDDDIIYPKDFVKNMVGFIKEKNNQVIISLHGNTFNKLPLERYYWQNGIEPSKKISYSCLGDVDEDVTVDMVGTACVAFHTSYFKPKLKQFKYNKMVDILFSSEAKKQGKKMMIMKHTHDYFTYNPKMYDGRYTICEEFDRNISDKIQIKIINETWKPNDTK